MPIHDQGYRHYTGERTLHRRGWWVIARQGILARLRERRFLALLLFAWSPFIVRAVQLYVGATIVQASFFAASPETFHTFLNQQRLFVFFITIYAGAGLIAADRQANALQIYLSKPITRREYIGGKLLTLVIFLIGVTWVPAMLLLLLQVLFTGSLDFLADHPRLIPAMTAASILQVALAAVLMVALSSLSKSRRFAAMLYAAFVLFAAALATVFQAVTGNALWVVISPQSTLLVITDALFGALPDEGPLLAIAVVALGMVFGACALILERRVRAVDVVA